MCLQTGRKITKKDKVPEYGWKIINCQEKFWKTILMREYTKRFYNRWLKVDYKCNIKYSLQSGHYGSGFHIFKTRKEAREWTNHTILKLKIIKIKIRKVKYIGDQSKERYRVYVCDEIFVPNPYKEKRKK